MGSRKSVALWALVPTAAAGIFTLVVLRSRESLADASRIAGIGSALLAVVTILVTLTVARKAALRADTGSAADELARWVQKEMREEAALRGLGGGSATLGVRWVYTSRPVTPAAQDVVGPRAGVKYTQLKLHGDVHNVTKRFLELPVHQMVVIGSAGSGKTSLAVSLVKGLLGVRSPGGQVPVLLSLASWDPIRVRLDRWLTYELEARYDRLTDVNQFGLNASRRLVDASLILPVLDGLDEMPASLRSEAVKALNNAVNGDEPFVLTSRAQEYENAISSSALARAAVVEMQPVDPKEVAGYLTAGRTESMRSRWLPVMAILAGERTGPLAQTLSSPLMAYVARTVYEDRDPSSLATFADREAIEEHLFDAYLPAVYEKKIEQPYDHKSVQQWLAFLATRIEGPQIGLAWWRLPAAVPSGWFAAGTGLSAAAIVGPTVWFIIGPPSGLLVGAVLAFVVGSAAAVSSGQATRDLTAEPPRRIGLARTSARSWLFSLALGIPTALIGTIAFRPAILGRDWFVDQRVFITLAVAAVLGFGLVLGFGQPIESEDVISPRSVLRADRWTAWLTASMAGMIAGSVFWVLVAPRIGIAVAVAVLLARLTGGTYGRYLLAHVLLATLGYLPWKLMTFLDDAQRRGVLRRIGAMYYFRHDRLRCHLATGLRKGENRQ